jgi:hypothetical protein
LVSVYVNVHANQENYHSSLWFLGFGNFCTFELCKKNQIELSGYQNQIRIPRDIF